jgi:hypothetical protein
LTFTASSVEEIRDATNEAGPDKREGVHDIQDAPFHPRVLEIDKLAEEEGYEFWIVR